MSDAKVMLDGKVMLALYVESMQRSIEFYEDLLASKPLEQSDAFAMFALPSGLLLGLWLKETVQPTISSIGVGNELIFSFNTQKQVNAIYDDMKSKYIQIEQHPTQMDFGYTFVINDPDNHRIRFFCEAME